MTPNHNKEKYKSHFELRQKIPRYDLEDMI